MMGARTCIDCGVKFDGRTTAIRCKSCRYENLQRNPNGSRRAVCIVNTAIKGGMLASPKGQACTDCGGAATVYDHRDYNKPLEVAPVCRSCNAHRGKAIPLVDFSRSAIGLAISIGMRRANKARNRMWIERQSKKGAR